MIKFDVLIKIVLTWSKVIALVMLILVWFQKDVNLMMFAIPFITLLITGKQVSDGYFKKN